MFIHHFNRLYKKREMAQSERAGADGEFWTRLLMLIAHKIVTQKSLYSFTPVNLTRHGQFTQRQGISWQFIQTHEKSVIPGLKPGDTVAGHARRAPTCSSSKKTLHGWQNNLMTYFHHGSENCLRSESKVRSLIWSILSWAPRMRAAPKFEISGRL